MTKEENQGFSYHDQDYTSQHLSLDKQEFPRFEGGKAEPSKPSHQTNLQSQTYPSGSIE